jgi:uncharacterized protein
MRIIAHEEHFIDADLAAASSPAMTRLGPHFAAAYESGQGFSASPARATLADIGESRLAAMDEGGITMQVLSCLWAQQAPADVAVDLVSRANDKSATAVLAHPDRFAAFAALPTAVPEAAARELERCISELGFVGAFVNGRTGDEFLDAPRFDPVLAAAARLKVPVYLHPALPPVAVTEAYYSGLAPLVNGRLQASAWGWHVETAGHFLHMVLTGVFDRYPDLILILGHWGELIPFYLERIEDMLPQQITKLERPFSDYFRQNAYITPSGMFSQEQLQFCVRTLGAERILFAVDYPFIGNEDAVPFLETARLSAEDKDLIAHANSEKLLGV